GAKNRRRACGSAARGHSGGPGRARSARAADHPAGSARGALELSETRAGEGPDDLLAVGSLVVPGQLDLAHQVRVRVLEPLVSAKHAGQPPDAALTADPADLDRLGLDRHYSDRTVRSATSATTASRLSARPTSSCRSPSQRVGTRARMSSTVPSSFTAGWISASSS